jgi:hypothetical protein
MAFEMGTQQVHNTLAWTTGSGAVDPIGTEHEYDKATFRRE